MSHGHVRDAGREPPRMLSAYTLQSTVVNMERSTIGKRVVKDHGMFRIARRWDVMFVSRLPDAQLGCGSHCNLMSAGTESVVHRADLWRRCRDWNNLPLRQVPERVGGLVMQCVWM